MMPDVTKQLTELEANIQRTIAARIAESERQMTERFTERSQVLERTITE